MVSIVISSGHGKYIRGASGTPVPPQLDEVNEARRVVDRVADGLRVRGATVKVFHDDVSTSQDENLNRIVDFHNAQGPHDLDVSVHFNAFDHSAHGTECLYISQQELAAEISEAIASVGFTDRGAKKRTDLFFLNNTAEPAVLIEVCFCDHTGDSELYTANFYAICDKIATVLGGPEIGTSPPPSEYLFQAKGECSYFGGPEDTGVSSSEGLAFHASINEANQHLFLPHQPSGTSGLARRLNARAVMYLACRWDYDVTSKNMLSSGDYRALVTNSRTGESALAWPADWGPNQNTGRVADLSPALMELLDLDTDDEVEVVFPYDE